MQQRLGFVIPRVHVGMSVRHCQGMDGRRANELHAILRSVSSLPRYVCCNKKNFPSNHSSVADERPATAQEFAIRTYYVQMGDGTAQLSAPRLLLGRAGWAGYKRFARTFSELSCVLEKPGQDEALIDMPMVGLPHSVDLDSVTHTHSTDPIVLAPRNKMFKLIVFRFMRPSSNLYRPR